MANGSNGAQTRRMSRQDRQQRRASCPDDQTALLQRIATTLEDAFDPLRDNRITVFNEEAGTETVLEENESRVGIIVHNDTVDSELLIRLGRDKPNDTKYTDRIAPGETRQYEFDAIGRWQGKISCKWRGPNVSANNGQALFTELIG